MRRCVRAVYGDLIFSGEVAGAFVAADHIDEWCPGEAVDLFCAVVACRRAAHAVSRTLAGHREEGPYWIDDRTFRRDIRDDQQGQDLLLQLQVIDAPRCEPLPDAVVEIWHCNALGYYSGYAGQDPDADPTEITDIVDHLPEQSPERWLRGAQRSDAEGNCEFLTVYPGWYSGRTVHIHLKVHLNGSRLITSQLYFPQELNDQIHQTGNY
jgi:protocatechuate 3,4-dioxygenase beta subunit